MKLRLRGGAADKPVPRRRLADRRQVDGQSVDLGKTDKLSFRRNRTLTGTSSGDIRPASELRGVIQSPRAAAHHLRQRRRRLSYWLVGGLAGALFTVGLLQQFTAEVRVALVGQVQPLSTQQQTRLIEPIDEYFSTRPIERVRLFLDEVALANYLQARGLREVKSIDDVRMDGWGVSRIQVKVREPIARWSIAGQDRLVDSEGVVFAVNYFQTPTVTIRDDSGISARNEAEAQSVTSSRMLAFVGRSVGYLRDNGIIVDSVILPASSTRQVHVLVSGERSIPLKMTVDRPAGEQAEDAIRALGHLAKDRVAPRYIDVRVSGMAYYR